MGRFIRWWTAITFAQVTHQMRVSGIELQATTGCSALRVTGPGSSRGMGIGGTLVAVRVKRELPFATDLTMFGRPRFHFRFGT